MEIYVEKAVVGQTQKGKPKTGLLAKGEWFNVFDAHPELEGCNVVLSQGKFKGWYDIEFVVDKTPPASKPEMSAATDVTGHPGASNGKISSLEWCAFMKMMGEVAKEMEPDDLKAGLIEGQVVTLDRSVARAALVNTSAIAFSNGKIEFEMPPESETPF